MMQAHPIPRNEAADNRSRFSERERFLEAVLASSADCIKVLDLDANLIFMSDGGMRVMEVSDFNEIVGCPWPDFWHAQGNIDAKEAIATAKAGGVGRFRGKANTFAGNPRWWDVVVTPILGADGKPERLLSVSRDITAVMTASEQLRKSEEQTRLMSDELQHRMKNTLAMIQAMVRQTLRNSASMADAQEALDHRLVAMGRAQNMLTAKGWTGSDLHNIVETALDLHSDGEHRFTVQGPKAYLAAQAATSLALLLHELATNATKYGALSVPTGHVDIRWTVTPDPNGDECQALLVLVWRETDGPPVSPPTRRGFGSRLVEQALSAALKGTAEISFLNEGVTCTVRGLVDRVTE